VFAESIKPPLQGGSDIWKLTYHDFAAIIDQTAWWLETFCKHIGLEKTSTIAYVGRSDVRYYVILVAAMKCGFPILFASRFNGTESLLSLMAETNCKALIFTPEVSFNEVQKQCGLPGVKMLSLEQLSFEAGVGKTPNYNKPQTFEEASERVAAVSRRRCIWGGQTLAYNV
jgi:long-subunit acyl-CoA synthetase (AMP-forming)